MMRKVLCPLLLLPLLTVAQNKMLTLEDAVSKQSNVLAPQQLSQTAFLPGTHVFAWIGKQEGKEFLITQDADAMTRDTVLEMSDLKILFTALVPDITPPERFPVLTWVNGSVCRFMHSNAFFAYDIRSKKLEIVNRIPKEAENAEIDTAERKISFTIGENVWVFKPETYAQMPFTTHTTTPQGVTTPKDFIITTDGDYGLSNGKAVHRNEWGINKGMFWSPKGKRLAYYKLFEGMVADYPLLQIESKPADVKLIKYPMAGGPSHIARVQIYDFEKKLSYPIQTGKPDEQFLTNIAFSPNEEDLYIAIVNREQNQVMLNKYDAVTGAFVRTLLVEEHPRYVEPEHPVVFVPSYPKWFIWQSNKDGHNHMYLYESSGKPVRQLTQGDFDVTQLLGFNRKGTHAYYMATSNNGLDRQCYAVELETGKSTALTKHAGVHRIAMSDDGKYFVDHYSNTGMPAKAILMNSEGLEKAVLLQSANPLISYKPCGMRLFSLPAADGAKLNCRMIYPPQFDSTKKHPVLVYVYGGPHAQLVTNSWLGGADMWLYYMAQQGYVVFTMDNRGSANRGRDFEQVTHRMLGKIEREDQLAGVDYLKKQKYVDATRMGVFGWSFGGFMTINLMTRTDVFKAGVAGGPVIDWSLYEVMYTERYMDMPQDNPEGYRDANMLNYVKDLKGKLMLIHGASDDVVLWQHSLKYIRKSIDENVQVDYFVYPEHKHNIRGKDRVHLMQRVTDYFRDNL